MFQNSHVELIPRATRHDSKICNCDIQTECVIVCLQSIQSPELSLMNKKQSPVSPSTFPLLFFALVRAEVHGNGKLFYFPMICCSITS